MGVCGYGYFRVQGKKYQGATKGNKGKIEREKAVLIGCT